MNSTDDTALLTFLLAKHITSCDNVLLKEYFFLATYGVFRLIDPWYGRIKKFHKSIKNWGCLV